jgi:RsiW-degrading membrane proteinase PrsW (M82 family)
MPSCPECGTENIETHLFCSECGTPLKTVEREPYTFTNLLKDSLGSLWPKGITPIDKPTDIVYEKLPAFNPSMRYLGLGVAIWGIYIVSIYMDYGANILPVILLTFVFPFTVFLWVRKSDRYEQEPLSLILFLFAWGIVSGEISGMLNPLMVSWMGAPGAAFIEEPAKALGVYYIARHSKLGQEFNGHMDGLIYGACAGVGFTWIEDIFYALDAGTPDYFILLLRGTTAFAHLVFTGLTGRNLGIAKAKRGYLVPTDLLAALIPGTLLHFIWNAAPGLTMFLLFIPYLYIFKKNLDAASADEERWGYRIKAPVE